METKKQYFKGQEFLVAKGGLHPDYSYHTFELEEHELRDKYWNINPGDVVFDVGASYGSYALSACVMGATVYAFEPEKTVFCDLAVNIELNSWKDKCIAFNFALWSERTIVDMKDYAPHWPTRAITSDYPTMTIDDIVNENNITKIDWIKIDVEGAEEHVLRGGLQAIKKFQPKFIIECHTFLDPKITENVKTILSGVGDYEFEEISREPCVILSAIPKHKLSKINISNFAGASNCIEPSRQSSKKLKLAFIFGSYSVGNRPLDFNNLFDNPRGLTGSDLGVTVTAKEMAKLGHDVSLFTVHTNNKSKICIWEGVKVYDFDERFSIIKSDFDAIISWSEPDVFRGITDKPVRVVCQMLNDFTYCQKDFDNYVDIWTAPSLMLMEYLVKQGTNPNKWRVLPLGCDFSWYKETERVPGRVVWTSSGDRGLHLLLQEWPKIKSAVPEANLKIFYNFGFDHINGIEPDNKNHSPLLREMSHRIRYIKTMIEKLKPLDVDHVGSVSRNRMADELSKAMVLAYPFSSVSSFTEGFSCSILESCAAGVFPVISSGDALGSVYDEVVPMVNVPVEKHMSKFDNLVIRGLTDVAYRYSVTSKCKEFAKKYTWQKMTVKLEEIILQSDKYRENHE